MSCWSPRVPGMGPAVASPATRDLVERGGKTVLRGMPRSRTDAYVAAIAITGSVDEGSARVSRARCWRPGRYVTGLAAAAVLVALATGALSGCGQPEMPRPQAVAGPLGTVRRVVVVASSDSAFSVMENRSDPGRTFDDIVKWTPYAWLRGLGPLVHEGINRLLDFGGTARAAPDAEGISPRSIVSGALARRLSASGTFEDVRAVASEPLGEERRGADGLVRVTVPAWGLLRVREGNPNLLSAFADAHAELVSPATGVVVWALTEDVTGPDRLPLESFSRDRPFTRQQLIEVLARAGERLASELLYARGAVR